jgi:RHS repeat-associated protein
MVLRASGTAVRRARIRARYGLTAAVTVLALGAAVVPAAGVASAAPARASHSAWGAGARRLHAVPVAVGRNRPPVSQPASARVRRLDAAVASSSSASSSSSSGSGSVPPSGQGQTPWHRYADTRLDDALVARVDLSSGDLLLAGTAFDIAGVGDRLQLAQTYSSFTGVGGTVGDRWWLSYERHLQVAGGDVYWIDSTGAAVHFTGNSDGTFTAPHGWAWALASGSGGTYTLTDLKSGTKESYDSSGALTKVTDRDGDSISVAQHSGGGFKLTEDRSGRWIDLTASNATQWKATDSAGRTQAYDTDGYGNLVKTVDTAGQTTTYGYESLGDGTFRVNKVTTPGGRVTKFTYDGQNRVTSMQRVANSDGTGPTWTYSYSAGDPTDAGTTTVKDPDLHSTVYTHDGQGRVTSVKDANGNSRSSTYDADNNVATGVDAMGTGAAHTTTYGWDAAANPTSVQLPTGASASLAYQTVAGADLPGTLTDPSGDKTKYTYDSAGNTLTVATSGADGGTTTSTYNGSSPTCGGFQGQKCSVKDPDGRVTKFTYDSSGNLTKVSPPSPQGATTYTYDALGRPLTATDGNGVQISYTYDARDRITRTEAAGHTAATTYTYDGDGNLTQQTDPNGTTGYVIDALGRETLRTLPDGSQTQLGYDPAGNVATYTDPTGTVTYSYDPANNLTQLAGPAGTTTYAYNNDNTRTKTSYPGGTTVTVTPDDSQRPQAIKATSPKGTLEDLTYSYASGASGGDGDKIHSVTDGVTGHKTTYSYDSQGRFTYAAETSGSSTVSSWLYCLDAAGDLTSQGTAAGCPGGTTYTYNAAGELTGKNGTTTGWSTDTTGNETAAAPTTGATRTGEQYTPYNQLSSITNAGTTYPITYTGTSNALRDSLGGTAFHNGPLGLAAQTTAGADTGFVREPAGTLNSMTTGGTSYYYLTDATGSVVGLTDASGAKVDTYAYSPRGVTRTTVTTETVPQPFQYAGAYHDPTGLYHLGARSYDPNLGRFTQPDPSGQETNQYLYAGGDPVNEIDPGGTVAWGEYALDCVKGGTMSAGIGLATGATETGVGAVGLLAGGCAEEVGTDVVSDYFDEDAGEAVNLLSTVKDLGDIGSALL